MPVCTATRAHFAVNKVVDVPVIIRDSGSAPDTVHRRIWWTFQLATETGTRLFSGYGGDERVVGVGGFFSAVSNAFFRALPGCPRVARQFSEPSTMKSSSSLRAPLHNLDRMQHVDIDSSHRVVRTTTTTATATAQLQHSVAILAHRLPTHNYVNCSQVLWVVRTSFFRRFYKLQWWTTTRQQQHVSVAPAPVDEHVAPAPDVSAAPAPVESTS